MIRSSFFLLTLFALLFVPGCARNPDTVTTPQAKIAHYGADVLEAVRTGQETVIAANKSQPTVMTDEATRATLDRIKALTETGTKFRDALIAYDAATTLDFRAQKAAEVKALIEQVNTLAAAAFKAPTLPSALVEQLAQFAVNIVTLTRTVSAEVEKLR
jgi:hypothetical protein